MEKEIVLPENYNDICNHISDMIASASGSLRVMTL